MSKIEILNENTANQIAAGEVVERPASVIKELIENSLDAGADQIDIHIENGGLSRIVVSDNGEGMSAQDAVLCFSRHATSKIRRPQDLEQISSFGFRGEALASISSVSKVSLVTRRKDDEQATEVLIEGGTIKKVGACAGKIGTRIEISELFFNTPARLKFLRSEKSEANSIDTIIRDISVAQPHVAFSFRNQGQTKIDVRKVEQELSLDEPRRTERTVALIGKETRGQIFSIDTQIEDLRICGYVCSPLVSRRDTKGIRIFVNGRVVQDRPLIQAVQIAYRTLLEVGRKPICAINIEIDPHLVDVNVHPQKSEVRFRESVGIQSKIIRTLQNFLQTTPWLSKSPTKSYVLKSSPPLQDSPDESMPSAEFSSFSLRSELPTHSNPGQVGWNLNQYKPQAIENQRLPMQGDKKRFFNELKVLGQIDQTYLVLDDGDNLVLVDQHAAHERVSFEKLRTQFNERGLKGQPLLFPKQLSLPEHELVALNEQQNFLVRFGFDAEQFGEDVALLRAIPSSLSESEAESIFKDFISEAANNSVATSLSDWIDKICAQIACHGSIRAGQTLGEQEINALLDQLDEIDYSAHCPHGRPTTKVVPYKEVAKWFHRS